MPAGSIPDNLRRFELLDGTMVKAEPKTPPHASAVLTLDDLVRSALPPGWHLRSEQPVTLSDSEPEPDLAIVRGKVKDYRDRHPGPADLAIVVEVAESTLERDRTTKKRIYTRAGIPLYLLLDLQSRRVFVWRPDREEPEIYTEADAVPVTIGGVAAGHVPVATLLP